MRPRTEATPAEGVSAVAAKGYSGKPPVIRERAPTMSLEEDDIVEAEPAQVAEAPRASSVPPPPPSSSPMRASSVPPPLPARASSRPPAPSRASSRVVRAVAAPVIIPPAPPVPAELAPPPAAAVAPPPPSSAVRLTPTPAPVVAAPAPAPAADPTRPSSLLDPTDVLFDSIYDLQFAETSWQAASVCATALAAALRARAVVIHAHDLERGQIRTIGAHGAGDFDVLGSAETCDDDFVASAVLSNKKPLTMRFDGELPRLAPKRLTTVGAKRSLVAVPAISWGRCIAVIEVIDADERLAPRVTDATAYVADHLASFLVRAAA